MHFHNSSPKPLYSEGDSGPLALSEAARSPSVSSRPLDGNDQGVLSPQMTHLGSLNSQHCWNNITYCEEGTLLTPTGPLPDWSFDHHGPAPTTHITTAHREYPDSFLASSFHDIPDITWDQTTPDSANPATPPSPCYRNLNTDYVPEMESFFDPGESRRPYCPQKPRAKPYQSLALSQQHKLRSQKIKRARQDSPKLGLEFAEHYGFLPQPIQTPPNMRKREHSPSMTFTSVSCFDEDHGTPETQVDEPDGDNTSGSEPYAQLIYRALRSVPGHSMVLKDIYEWFERNTDKPQTSTSAKGWQNSIRHNLSMNGAFNKVDQIPPSEDAKKGFIWVLADSALQEGVKSTTRYRKQNPSKKSCRAEHPAPQRQISGAKGGKAAKKSALYACKMNTQKPKRIPRVGRGLSSYSKANTANSPPFPTIGIDDSLQLEPYYEQEPSHNYFHTPSETPISLIPEPRSFTLSDIVGCADLGDGQLFYHDAHEGATQLNQQIFTQSDDNIGYDYSGVTA